MVSKHGIIETISTSSTDISLLCQLQAKEWAQHIADLAVNCLQEDCLGGCG